MNNQKTRSVLAYIFNVLGAIIVLVMKDSTKKTKFHAAQAFTVYIVFYIARVIAGFIPGHLVSAILNILCFVLVIMGIVKAANDDAEPKLPVIGDWAESIFKGIIESGVDDEIATTYTTEGSNDNPIEYTATETNENSTEENHEEQ